MPSQEMQNAIAVLRERQRAGAGQKPPALAELRASFTPGDRLYPLPQDVHVREVTAAGVPAHWLAPPGVDPGRVLLFLHGGGFELGSLHSDGELAARLGRAGGMRVLFPGIPVARDGAGRLTGVEAVVDKDLTAAELASTLKAGRLLVLTDVPAIIRDYGTPDARPIPAIDTSALAAMTFPAGSLGPKAEGCIRFVRASGQPAAIGALADAAAILAGRAGTTIRPG